MKTANGRIRIGLVTDTHIPTVAVALPQELFAAFKDVDAVFHGGDIYAMSVLEELARIAPVYAARGDDDDHRTSRDPRVKDRHVFEMGGKIIHLVHERPYPFEFRRYEGTSTASLESRKPDIVVFGHEHEPSIIRRDGILYVNSGSPTFLGYRYGLGTVGILEIDSGEATAEIKHL